MVDDAAILQDQYNSPQWRPISASSSVPTFGFDI